jgi:hypothetical protein
VVAVDLTGQPPVQFDLLDGSQPSTNDFGTAVGRLFAIDRSWLIDSIQSIRNEQLLNKAMMVITEMVLKSADRPKPRVR